MIKIEVNNNDGIWVKTGDITYYNYGIVCIVSIMIPTAFYIEAIIIIIIIYRFIIIILLI